MKLQCGSCVRVCNSATGTSDTVVIRLESSQGYTYSFRGNANTAHQDRTLSPRVQGSVTVNQGHQHPSTHRSKNWANMYETAEMSLEEGSLLAFSWQNTLTLAEMTNGEVDLLISLWQKDKCTVAYPTQTFPWTAWEVNETFVVTSEKGKEGEGQGSIEV